MGTEIYPEFIDNGEHAYNQSGKSVKLSKDGTTLLIGEPFYGSNQQGRVRVLQWTGSTWEEKGDPIVHSESYHYFGTITAISENGNTIAIGVPMNSPNYNGFTKVYEWDGSSWNTKGAQIEGTNNATYSSRSIGLSLDGSTLAINDPGHNNYTGAITLYQWNSSTWTTKNIQLTGTSENSYFGKFIALSGDANILVAASFTNNTKDIDIETYKWNGSVYEDTRNTLTITKQQADTYALHTMSNDGFQLLSLSETGDTLVVADIFNEGGTNVYTLNTNDEWTNPTQIGDANAGFSAVISPDGNRIAVASIPENSTSNVKIYAKSGSSWNHEKTILGSQYNDKHGFAVSLSETGTRIAIGAPTNTGLYDPVVYSGANSGQVRVFDYVSVNTEATVTVSLVSPINNDVTVTLEVSGNANEGADYTIDKKTLTIPAGSISATARISIQEDAVTEESEYVFIEIVNVSGANVNGMQSQIIYIQD